MIRKRAVKLGGAAAGDARWLCRAVSVILLHMRVDLAKEILGLWGKSTAKYQARATPERDKSIWVCTFDFSW